jgi:hypothetical protein
VIKFIFISDLFNVGHCFVWQVQGLLFLICLTLSIKCNRGRIEMNVCEGGQLQ